LSYKNDLKYIEIFLEVVANFIFNTW